VTNYFFIAEFFLGSLDVEQRLDLGVEAPPRPLLDVIELAHVALDARCR